MSRQTKLILYGIILLISIVVKTRNNNFDTPVLLENGVEPLEFKLDIYSPSKADLLELYFQNNFPIEDSLFDKCVINFRPDELEICVKYNRPVADWIQTRKILGIPTNRKKNSNSYV